MSKNKYWNNFSEKLLILCIILLFNTIYAEIKTITLKGNEENKFTIEEIKSSIFYVNGDIDKSKKYLLISTSFLDDYEYRSPYFFITKRELFSHETDEYDYTSIQEIDNMIALPQNYFYSGGLKGFYLNITCINSCKKFELNFLFVNKIELKLGQMFSFYAKNETVDSFVISVKGTPRIDSSSENIAFILSGGDEDQLSMEIDSCFAPCTTFPNVFLFTKQLEEEETEVYIKVSKNVKFTFKTEIFNLENEKSERIIYEEEYNQYFIINENINECFKVKSMAEPKEGILHELFLVSKDTIKVSIYDKNEKSYTLELPSANNFNNIGYESLTDEIRQICLTTKAKQAIINLFIRRRMKEESSSTPVKMAQPLIDPAIYVSNRNASSFINVYSHSHFFDKDTNYSEMQGMNMGISSINGFIHVYKTRCKTFPYCSYSMEELNELIKEENSNTDFQTINPINGHYSMTFSSHTDSYSMSNYQDIIIVVCNETENKNLCLYTISFYPIQQTKHLARFDKLTKYLGKYKEYNSMKNEDKYSIALHRNNKIVIDLIVYSGDAYILPTLVPEKCFFEEHHLGSNERRVFYCSSDFEITNYLKYYFKVRANDDGAVYTIYAAEKKIDSMDDAFPVEMTTMESVHEKRINLFIDGGKSSIYLEPKENSFFLTLFNTINCDLKITNKFSGKVYYTRSSGFALDTTSTRELNKDNVEYDIIKVDSSHADEKNCLFYVSSNYLLNNNSYLFIPESKPFKFKLSNDTRKIRSCFLYSPRDSNPRVYLRVNLFNNIPIKLSIKAGYNPMKEYIFSQSKDILIIDGSIKGLRLNTINQIKIIAEMFNENEESEIIVDLNIKTKSYIPYPIKTEEYFSDMVNKNSIQYYVSLMSQNSRGDILLNFKRGTGVIYARLIQKTLPKEIGGWNNRIILPSKDTKYPLNFDFYEQKLTITEEDTDICENYCYLLFGVTSKDDYFSSEEFSSSYSLYFRYANADEYNNNFISISNNEFILNSLKSSQNDYYIFKLFSDAEEIIIDFKSDYCSLTIALNTSNFDNEKKTFKYLSNGSNKIFKITKEEIIKKLSEDITNLLSIEDLVLYIRIGRKFEDTSIDIDKLDMKYKFRINIPNQLMKKIITIDTSHPIFCENSLIDGFCDYLLKLDAYDYYSNIEIVALSSNNDKLAIYGNIITSNEFTRNITKGKLPEWPTVEKHQFPDKNHKTGNLLKLTLFDIPLTDENSEDPRVLIRVYSPGKSSMEIIASLFSPSDGIIPFAKDYQLYSADTEKGIKINIPSDHSYIAHLITISGKGFLTINNEKNHTLFGDYKSLLIYNKEGESTSIKVLGTKYDSPGEYDSNYRFYLWYTKNIYVNNSEQISVDSSCSFIHQQKNLPLAYYLKLKDFNKDLSFTIKLSNLTISKGNQDIKDLNATENFIIKGSLFTEEELVKMQINSNISTKNEYLGTYDYAHHEGYIIIDSENIKKFVRQKSNNENNTNIIYAYITVEKSSSNRREYNHIEGSITSFSPNEIKRTAPSDIYLTNYFKAHNNTHPVTHIYNINGLSSVDGDLTKMKIEFSTVNKNIKIKIIKSPESTIEDPEYFNIVKFSDKNSIGKEIIIIKRHIKEAYLLIECPSTPYDSEYTFKYSSTMKESFDYQYNSIINYKRISSSSSKVKLTIDKIKEKSSSKIIDANYFIRIYEENNNLGDLENSIAFRKINPYLIYKISNDDEILKNKNQKSFEIEIQVSLTSNYYIDIIAEVLENNEYLGYKRFYPKPEENKEENNGKSFKNKTVYLLIGITGLLILVFILLFALAFIYKNKNANLEKRVEEISFNISRGQNSINETDNKDNENALLQ